MTSPARTPQRRRGWLIVVSLLLVLLVGGFLLSWPAIQQQRAIAMLEARGISVSLESTLPEWLEARCGPWLHRATARASILEQTLSPEASDSLCDGLALLHANLHGLYFSKGVVTDHGLSALARLPKLKHLRCQLSPQTRHPADLLAGFKSLEYLSLTATAFPAEQIRQLPRVAALQSLTLEGLELTDGDVSALCRVPHLKSLHLKRGSFTAESVRVLKQHSRARLNLKDVALDDAGWDELADLQIEELALREQPAHRTLEKICRLSQAKSISLNWPLSRAELDVVGRSPPFLWELQVGLAKEVTYEDTRRFLGRLKRVTMLRIPSEHFTTAQFDALSRDFPGIDLRLMLPEPDGE